jgi:ADP-ribosylation factor-like protein 2
LVVVVAGVVVVYRSTDRYTLNVWDVGGQKTLRPYWRNYFESTDAVVWVVDSSDRLRTQDCQQELKGLLKEEVRSFR